MGHLMTVMDGHGCAGTSWVPVREELRQRRDVDAATDAT
jgi:hypothetical protein